MWQLKLTNKSLFFLLAVFLFSIPSIVSLLHKGFMQTDDGTWMIIRFAGFMDALRDGQFPVRFLTQLNHGYGYPVSNFLYPGFMYLGVPLKVLGLSYVGVIKALFALSMIGSSFGMYLWLRLRFDYISSFTGAMAYLYLPYHLYDLTVRGSLGEVLSLAIVPFLLWALEKKKLSVSSLLTAFLILSHNTLAVLFLPVVYSYVFLLQRNNGRFLLAPLLLGIALSAFFWLPALVELPLTVFSQTDVSDITKYFANFQLLGYSTVLVLLLGIALLIKGYNRKPVVLLLSAFILTLFLALPISTFIWENVPGSFIQFPFRILSLSLLFAAVITANVIAKAPQKIFFSGLVVGVLLLSNMYFFPNGYDTFDDGFYATNQATTTVKDEYMPRWVKVKPTQYPDELAFSQSGSIKNVLRSARKIIITTRFQHEEVLRIQRIYYPGWKAYVDDKEVPIVFDNPEGIMEVVVPKGNHTLTLTFTETPLRLFADIMSLSGLIVLGIFIFRSKRR